MPEPQAALATLSAAELRRLADEVESRECTGVAATWCPVHGDCACPRDDEDDESAYFTDLNDPTCPLHSSRSAHAASYL